MCCKRTIDVDFAQCQPVCLLSGAIDLYEQESPRSDVIAPQSLQDSVEHAVVDQADIVSCGRLNICQTDREIVQASI
jgi:hypothetical protein